MLHQKYTLEDRTHLISCHFGCVGLRGCRTSSCQLVVRQGFRCPGVGICCDNLPIGLRSATKTPPGRAQSMFDVSAIKTRHCDLGVSPFCICRASTSTS